MSKAKKSRTPSDKIIAKLSPAELAARQKKLAYNTWKSSLEKRGLWKKRDNYKRELARIRAKLVLGTPKASSVVKEALNVGAKQAQKAAPAETAQQVANQLQQISRFRRLSEIGARLEELEEEQAKLTSEASQLLKGGAQ